MLRSGMLRGGISFRAKREKEKEGNGNVKGANGSRDEREEGKGERGGREEI